MISRRPGRPAEKQLMISLMISCRPGGRRARGGPRPPSPNDFINDFINDFPPAGEAGGKTINDFINDFIDFINDFPPAGGGQRKNN